MGVGASFTSCFLVCLARFGMYLQKPVRSAFDLGLSVRDFLALAAFFGPSCLHD